MHKSQITAIAAFAVLAMAAFAGVAVLADDASAEADSLTVKFDVQGTVYTKVYESDAIIASIVLPTLTDLKAGTPAGYEFKGWKESAEATTVTAAGSTIEAPEANTTYYAELTKISYTVTFTVEGQDSTTDNGTISEMITFPEDPVKDGYNFVGWAVDGKVVEIPAEGIAFSGNVTYSAVFAEDFSVSFDINGTVITGGTVSDYTVPVVGDDALKGYDFAGWMVGETFIEDISDYIAKATAPVVLTAKFAPEDCTVTFTVDGVTVMTQTVKYDSKAVEPAMEPKKDGMAFIGWAVADKAYDFDAPVKGDVTLVALFEEVVVEPVIHYVRFTNVSGDDLGTFEVSKLTAIPKAPAIEGKKFAGWMIAGEIVSDPLSYVKSIESPVADIVFVASYAEADPVPEPTGKDDPMTLTAWIVIAALVLILVAAVIINREKVRVWSVEKLSGKKKEGGEE